MFEGLQPKALSDRQDRLAAELLGLVERRLRIVGADIERDVAVAVVRLPDAAVFLVDHRVRDLAGNLLRLPTEELTVELLKLAEILAGDLEVHDGMCHCGFFSHMDGACVTHGSSPGLPPPAAISRRGR
jgi:hypothetical protein